MEETVEKNQTSGLIEALKRIPPNEVVRALGLQPARERNKFACPRHGGSSLHVYEDSIYCFGDCGQLSNIDLVMAARGLDFHGAVTWLKDTFGGQPNATGAAPSRAAVDTTLHRRVLASLLAYLQLTQAGRDYLASRGLDPDRASAKGGFASIDIDGWDDVRDYLRREFSNDDLERAGLRGLGWFSREPGRQSLWPEPVDALVIPYRGSEDQLYAVRLRRISGDEGPKYYSLRGAASPPEPFGAQFVYKNCAGRVVHLTEGELDAWTLFAQYGELALGSPGARALKAEWFSGLENAAGLTIWGDADKAGDGFADEAVRHVEAVLGASWMERHPVYRARLRAGCDVNDLHRSAELASLLNSEVALDVA